MNALFLLLCAAAPAAAQRYEAWLRSGERVTGARLRGLPSGESARLEERELFRSDDPVRRLRDVQRPVRRRGTVVEMTNGDMLPGRLVGWAPPAPDGAAPERFLIAIGDSPGGDLAARTVAVRAECVRRMFPAENRFAASTPGLVIARDGRRAVARSLRFAEGAVHALTDAGVLEIPFGELAELHPPRLADTADLLRDGVWSDGAAENPVVRLVTTGGAELTFCRAMTALAPPDRPLSGAAPHEHLAVRPAWALDTILVNPNAVASRSYRNLDEIPLSLLPAETLEQRSILHFWLWRRNAGVSGGELRCGSRSADLGVGMPAGTAVAFELPAGAEEFSAWVGLDAAVGLNGCIRCRIHRDALDGPVVWESGFLRGGQEPQRVEQLAVQGARRLVLVVDFGHEGRPKGAPPWDIGDHAVWLDPLVTVDRSRLPTPESEPERWIPQLAGWEISDAMRRRLSLRPVWDGLEKQWRIAMTTDLPGDQTPFQLTRRLQVDLSNAVLAAAAANDHQGDTHHAIYVEVDGRRLGTAVNGVIHTQYTRRRETARREWSLGQFRDQSILLAVLIEPQGPREGAPMGLVWEGLGLRPLVEGLPSDGQPLAPDVPLASLAPLSATAGGEPLALQPGRLPDGRPLEIRGWRFEEGFGAPTSSEITYRLDPRWRRLVAIIGLAGGWKGAGPYSILLDGKLHWECAEPLSFGPNSPGRQIDVPIPPGHETITLRVQGDDSYAAWACAGFVE